MNIKYINKKLRKNLKKKRYTHSLSTAIEAKKLANKYKVDEEKAYIAGLLHDCAKHLTKKQMRTHIKSDEYSTEFLNSKTLMHAPVGAIIAKKKYGIEDKDILNAIKYHCYAKPNMMVIEKIIFIADKIELTRNFEDIDYLRDLAYRNLDKALLYCLNFTIEQIKKEKGFLYNNTINAKKYYENIIENKDNI